MHDENVHAISLLSCFPTKPLVNVSFWLRSIDAFCLTPSGTVATLVSFHKPQPQPKCNCVHSHHSSLVDCHVRQTNMEDGTLQASQVKVGVPWSTLPVAAKTRNSSSHSQGVPWPFRCHGPGLKEPSYEGDS